MSSATNGPIINDIMKCTEPTIIEGGLAVDDRGQLSFANNLAGFEIKRFYQVHNHQQGFVRAWHGHTTESKLVWVIQGAIILRTISIQDTIPPVHSPKFVLSFSKPQLLFIPKGYYNGFKTLTQDTSVMFFSNKTLAESKNDDIRLPWNHAGSDTWDIEQR